MPDLAHLKLFSVVCLRRTSLQGVYWRRWVSHRIDWVLDGTVLGTTTAFAEGMDFIRVYLGREGKWWHKKGHRIEGWFESVYTVFILLSSACDCTFFSPICIHNVKIAASVSRTLFLKMHYTDYSVGYRLDTWYTAIYL